MDMIVPNQLFISDLFKIYYISYIIILYDLIYKNTLYILYIIY